MPSNIPNHVNHFFPISSETPLYDYARSIYTSRVHEHYSLAQLKFIVAKVSSVEIKKQYKKFATTTTIIEEKQNA